jgi:hypothetical protein
MPLIAPVPRHFFSGGRHITDDTPRSLWSILNELIDSANSAAIGGGLYKIFTHLDIVGGKVDLGPAPDGTIISEVSLAVTVAFNAGLLMTIGDDLAQGRLLTAAQNKPSTPNIYKRDVDYRYSPGAQLNLYVTGVATQGEGAAIIYMSKS